MNARSASWYRKTYRDKSTSGSVAVGTAGVNNVVAVPDARHTLFVQRVWIYITTDAAQTITVQDDAGTPVVILFIPASAGKATIHEIDLGPKGLALTEGKNLDISGTAGPAYNYVIDGYARQTSSASVAQAAAA